VLSRMISWSLRKCLRMVCPALTIYEMSGIFTLRKGVGTQTMITSASAKERCIEVGKNFFARISANASLLSTSTI